MPERPGMHAAELNHVFRGTSTKAAVQAAGEGMHTILPAAAAAIFALMFKRYLDARKLASIPCIMAIACKLNS